MASKSKKRRRVLGASCILAALIIAGSSFAWFTSKDEVTNRLSANADYDVSIIENFAPPKQWVPGQTVKKEEAVTNTGNVDAFVKQQITGDLEVTVEIPASTPPEVGKGYITLKPAEYGAIEAGSYLAWKPAADTTNKIGKQVVYAINNSDDNDKNDVTDFTPVAEGLYIFRRAVTTEKKVDGTNSTLEDTAYEYVGYYYKDGVYYKLNRIDKNSLEAGTDGNLTSAPTVMYAKEATEAIKKVPMAYYDDNNDPRLVVNYQTNRSSELSNMANLDNAAYKAYDNYLDALTGKTSWRPDTSYTGKVGKRDQTTITYAADGDNKTGLIDNDEYFNDPQVVPDTTNFTNWSFERLTDRATETQKDLDAASPGGKYDGSNADNNWTKVYGAAVADRATVNKGQKSAERLALLKADLYKIVGADTTKNGVHQKDKYDFHYSSDLYTVDPATGEVTVVAPSVVLANPTAPTGNAKDSNNVYTLTLDNMNDDGSTNNDGDGLWNDNKVTSGAGSLFGGTARNTNSKAEFTTEDPNDRANFNAQFDYNSNVAEGAALRTAWDNYVNATKRQVLVDAKIKLVEDAIAAATNSTTDVGRKTELEEKLIALKSDKRVIDDTLKTNKAAYEKLILGDGNTKGIKDYIDQLNAYQDDINAANEVDRGKTYDTTLGGSHTTVYKGDQSTDNASNYPDDPSTVFNSGTGDTISEAILKQYLLNTYGVAVRDNKATSGSAGTYVEKNYVGANDTAESPLDAWPAADEYKDIYTYSPTETKKTVDENLDKVTTAQTTGIIAWKTPTTAGYGTITADNSGIATQSEVADSPYYINEKVNMMKDYRDYQINDSDNGLLKKYNDAKKAAVAVQDSDENLDPITIIVHLDNIDNTPNDRDKWQYIANATDANEYNFFYTSILGSGETSKLLIKSVEMSEGVTQDMFRDLQFDLNVVAESAQAQYEDGLAMPTAANASLSGGQTTKDTGYAEDEKVAWKKRTTATTNNITNKDPDGKAETEVDGTKTAVYGKIGTGAATPYNVEKVTATTVSGNSYIYKIENAGKTYYGNSTANGAEFKKIAATPATQPFAFATGAEAETIVLCDAPAP